MPRGRPRKKDNMLMKSAEFIGWALGGLEREIAATRQRLTMLNEQAAKLRARIGVGPRAGAGRKRKRRRMSPEARKRISEMMKKRWAERRKAKA